MANVLAHQVVSRGDHDVPLSAVTHTLQNLPHTQSNGRLARARSAGEAHVERWHSRVEAELSAHLRYKLKTGEAQSLMPGKQKRRLPVSKARPTTKTPALSYSYGSTSLHLNWNLAYS